MFVWSSSASPVSDVFGNGTTESYNDAGAGAKDVRVAVASPRKGSLILSIHYGRSLAVHSGAAT